MLIEKSPIIIALLASSLACSSEHATSISGAQDSTEPIVDSEAATSDSSIKTNSDSDDTDADLAVVEPQIISGAYLSNMCGPHVSESGDTIGIGCSSLTPGTSFQDYEFSGHFQDTETNREDLEILTEEIETSDWQIIFDTRNTEEGAEGTLHVTVRIDSREQTIFKSDFPSVRQKLVFSRSRVNSPDVEPTGLQLTYFDFSTTPQPAALDTTEPFSFSETKPSGNLVIKKVNFRTGDRATSKLSNRKRLPTEKFGIHVQGFLFLAKDCKACEFDLNSDTASFLSIDGETVLENGGHHPMNHPYNNYFRPKPDAELVQTAIPLSAGYHEIEIISLHVSIDTSLVLSARRSTSRDFRVIPTRLLFMNKPAFPMEP